MKADQSGVTSSSPSGESLVYESPTRSWNSRHRLRWILFGVVFLCAVALSGSAYIVWRYRVKPFPYVKRQLLPVPLIENGALVLSMPNGNLVGQVGVYSDELVAYLQFEYLQGLPSLAGSTILMTTREVADQPRYVLYIVLKNDLLSQSRRLANLQIDGYIRGFELDSPPSSELEQWTRETRVFDAAYHQPVRKRLLQLQRSDLTSAVATFILFKRRTDRRVREHIEPASERTFTAEDARDFAADMIDVAKFYGIPLDMLIGIGAMENNYLDVRGDLRCAIWKKHAQRGDIVLRRRKGRVLVSNYSQGPWQITRETLRYVHRLFLQDKRDYSQLPPRLRPPRVLDLNHVDTHVLTTYAGLLLRKLLDSFNGDVEKAQGAYNGGLGSPNLTYSAGVSMVAKYAHRVLSMAAGRKGNAVDETALKVTTTSATRSSRPRQPQ